jgi:hypothetical protein
MPAFGAPSPLSIAKKALKTAKKANKRAKTANGRAVRANSNAKAALGLANETVAWVKALPTTGIVSVTGPENSVPPGQVAYSIASCPAGSRVISGGGNAITSEGIVASQATSDRTAWFVLTFERSSTGTVQAVAYCAKAGALTIARHRSNAHREVKALKQQYLERLR